VAALIILLNSSSVAQIGAIVFGGMAGLWLCRAAGAIPSDQGHMSVPVSRPVGLLALAAFFLLLAGLPILSSLTHSQAVALFEAFYRSGALVFGGGHVVLPLLREATVAQGWVTDDVFLTGYGAAQAVPVPLFTFSAYLGAVMGPSPNGLAGAAISLVGIFVPDGDRPRPGGWNRIHLVVDNLPAEVARLRAAGVQFRNEIVTGPGGSQILLIDPSGNLVELFQPAPR
jgi:chromate transporter